MPILKFLVIAVLATLLSIQRDHTLGTELALYLSMVLMLWQALDIVSEATETLRPPQSPVQRD